MCPFSVPRARRETGGYIGPRLNVSRMPSAGLPAGDPRLLYQPPSRLPPPAGKVLSRMPSNSKLPKLPQLSSRSWGLVRSPIVRTVGRGAGGHELELLA